MPIIDGVESDGFPGKHLGEVDKLTVPLHLAAAAHSAHAPQGITRVSEMVDGGCRLARDEGFAARLLRLLCFPWTSQSSLPATLAGAVAPRLRFLDDGAAFAPASVLLARLGSRFSDRVATKLELLSRLVPAITVSCTSDTKLFGEGAGADCVDRRKVATGELVSQGSFTCFALFIWLLRGVRDFECPLAKREKADDVSIAVSA